MNNTLTLVISLIIMAGVTYLTRVITMILGRRPIKNIYIKSFLFYLPYTVLTVMIFPTIIFSTQNFYSAISGSIVALLLSYHRRGLATVAVASIATVYIVELLILYI